MDLVSAKSLAQQVFALVLSFVPKLNWGQFYYRDNINQYCQKLLSYLTARIETPRQIPTANREIGNDRAIVASNHVWLAKIG
jgi:hypothetical protein